ncbi:MAG: dTMP kinase [Rhodospirillaceae bacterium]|jgi:dTMP kinase|nr:dTMP kinase [Rhodospirillaceae bacterium]
MQNVAHGRFITFEGGEGTGKSTQVQLLAKTLRNRGLTVLTTREPGGTTGAEQIRQLLIEGKTKRWMDAITEILLYFAARRDHLVRVIWPALNNGQWVLCDRFADSTLAYQGYGHGFPIYIIEQLYEITVGKFAPDLTIVLDLSIHDGLHRAMNRESSENRYEYMNKSFHKKVREGFIKIATKHSERCVLLFETTSTSIEEIQSKVFTVVEERLLIAV